MSIEFNQRKFIRQVRDFLEKNGISYRDFSKDAGISPMTIYRAGKGEFALKLKTIQKIEKAMDDYLKDLE